MSANLITGTKSGLGRYVYERLGGIGVSRETKEEEIRGLQRSGADVIIHCAWNAAPPRNQDDLYRSFQDNFLFTQQVLAVPHRKFIFISSVDVYGRNSRLHSEDENVAPGEVTSLYGFTKCLTEAAVRARGNNWLILRPTSLLGLYSRMNSALKILFSDSCILGLTGDSTFNYVRHRDVFDVIECARNKNLCGIYNVASRGNVTLSEVAEMFRKKVIFGDFRYAVGRIDNRKVASLFPAFEKSSREVLAAFHEEHLSQQEHGLYQI